MRFHPERDPLSYAGGDRILRRHVTYGRCNINLTPRNGEKLSSSQVSASLDWLLTRLVPKRDFSRVWRTVFGRDPTLHFSEGKTTDDLVSRISSLSVTVSNEVGTSNAISLTP